MENPNQKLFNALECFFLNKVAELKKKYHFDQMVNCHICRIDNDDYFINFDEKGVYFSDCAISRGNSKQLDDLATSYSDMYPNNFYKQFYYGFYIHYKDIVKLLDFKQKEQDDLYRIVERFGNRDKSAGDFVF